MPRRLYARAQATGGATWLTARGKSFERELARDVGTQRIPLDGRVDSTDFETELFVFEAKHRAGEFPLTVSRWLERVVAKARSRRPEKIGIVVIQRPRHRRMDALVVLTWKDWLDLHHGKTTDESDG